uniref:Uncharacterized protein n=1 Tax=Anguilla anguilla TaxID=7936 RepID=A0A0E9WFH5_ANGAN
MHLYFSSPVPALLLFICEWVSSCVMCSVCVCVCLLVF